MFGHLSKKRESFEVCSLSFNYVNPIYNVSQIISYVVFFSNLELASSKPFFLVWQEVDLIVTMLEFLNLRTHMANRN